ncbi:MAG: hypothetical protein J0I84_04300 [Terrimonas sp.]|nr:hypothetical protein [Terrimonas sp.]OJY95349.1 MAG: hypothetical protein BGP13_13735 [Sphingobacteriales bacterium 40-81]
MKRLIIGILQLYVCQLYAQYSFFTPEDAFAIEVSLDNTSLKRLPGYRNAITSLVVSGDYIIGGTSADAGLTPFVFTASLSKREMHSIVDVENVIPGQQRIRTGFSKGKNNTFYAGTLPGVIDKKPNAGGHLIAVTVDAGGHPVIRDLGIPVPGEGIFSLTIDAKGNNLYGITYPAGIFFSYSIATKKINTYHDIVPTAKDTELFSEYLLEADDYLCSALAVARNGLVLGSAPVNRMFAFNPIVQQFEFFKKEIPEVWGRRSLGQIESWAMAANGKLFAGNAGDGQLLEVDPVSRNIRNLGKPIMMPRLRGLAFAYNGKLFGIAGALPGYAHLFSYDPAKEGFKDYGNPQFKMIAPGVEQGIDWRGFQLGTIASSEDGKYIVIGEDEAFSQLLVFPASAAKD